jgi:hypothetical protein
MEKMLVSVIKARRLDDEHEDQWHENARRREAVARIKCDRRSESERHRNYVGQA